MSLPEIKPSLRYHLFLDLDGVLADFDRGVRGVTGRSPQQLKVSTMWRNIHRADEFFANLPWTADGAALWDATRHLNPTILTGLPHGDWAERQKRVWCARELGESVEVITCLSAHKSREAHRHITESEHIASDATPIIIDDRTRYQSLWEERGGVYIVHTAAQTSIEALALVTDEIIST